MAPDRKERPRLRQYHVRLRGSFQVLVLLACIGTLAGFAGAWAWWLDLFSHFREQWALILTVAALVALYRFQKRAVAYGVLAAVNASCLTFFSIGTPGPPVLRVMLCNVNRDRGDPEQVRAAIDEIDPDVLVLLEVDRTWMTALDLPEGESGWYGLRLPRPDSFGIVLLARSPFESVSALDLQPPAIAGALEVEGRIIHFLAVHPPPPYGPASSRARDQQLEEFALHFEGLAGPRVLVGDLNATPWSASRKRLQEVLRDETSHISTWPALPWPLRIPIDSVLLAGPIDLKRATIGPRVGSDHFPLVVDLAFE